MSEPVPGECARRGRLFISTDPAIMDIDAIHGFLSRVYWSAGIPRSTLERAIAGSVCFGMFDDEVQIGFARVVTDRATFAYLCDVFVLEPWRGRGLGKWLVQVVVEHPDVQVRRVMLATRDAHDLYAALGFAPVAAPERLMERYDPAGYR